MGKRKSKNDRAKVAVVFDENKRREYLSGFRKRKLERKKKAQEDIQRKLKEEKKRIRLENKESYKKLVVSSRPIPDLEEILQEKEYEDDDVNIKIVELSSDTLQNKNLCIGANKPYQSEEPKHNKKKEKLTKDVILGMQSDYEDNDESEPEPEETVEPQEFNTKTKKELKQLLKRQATKKIQKSKVFQMKSKLDRIKNIKKSQSKKRTMKHNIEKNQKLKRGLSRKGKEGGKFKKGSK